MGFLDGFFFFRGSERVGPTEWTGLARAVVELSVVDYDPLAMKPFGNREIASW
jgi:hypothetical protein